MARSYRRLAGLLLGLSLASGGEAQEESIRVEISGDTGVRFHAEWRVTDGDGVETLTSFAGEAPRTFTFQGSALAARIVKGEATGPLNVTIVKGGNRNRHTIGSGGGKLNIEVR